MPPEIFADGFANISFTNGMVRIDLASVPSAQPGQGGAPAPETHHRIVLNPQGFLQSVAMMQDLVNKMVDGGVLKRREEQAAPQDIAVSETDTL